MRRWLLLVGGVLCAATTGLLDRSARAAEPQASVAVIRPLERGETAREPLGAAQIASPTYALSAPERQEVREIIAEFIGPQRSVFTEGLVRSGRYLPMIRSILAERRLPEDLAYLALVESHYRPDARSAAGAIGMWQFIDVTARQYGLRIDSWVDERLDPEVATRAAARLMEDLYRQFRDWDLAVAAYNGGGGRVGRAMDRHGLDSFWDLFGIKGLRHETCRYVVKFHAAVAIASDPLQYGLVVPEREPPLEYDLVTVERSFGLGAVARLSGVPLPDLQRLNPALLRGRTPPGSYVLKVPSGAGAQVEDALRNPAAEEAEVVRHKVAKRETLFALARKYGLTAKMLAEANGLETRTRLRPGDELVIPGAARAEAEPVVSEVPIPEPARKAQPAKAVHVVRRGETLWEISKRYGLTAAQLLRLNGRRGAAVLKPGDRLVVALSSSSPAL